MRRVLVLALLAMALPIAAWADSIVTATNQNGTVAVTGMSGTKGLGTIGVSTITLKGAELTQWGTTTGHLGNVKFQTGALTSGSMTGGGAFAGGGYFDITGVGTWASQLTGVKKCGSGCALFTGSFTGPITWTLVSSTKNEEFLSLTGAISGMYYTGVTITGNTTQNISFLNKAQLNAGVGHATLGTTNFKTVPEPGTLGLLGTGLVGIAEMFRRKLMGT